MKRVALAVLLVLGLAADAQACRSYLHNTRMAIGNQVRAIGDIEALVLGRLLGSADPPFEELARSVWAILAVLYPPSAAIAERRLRRCRNWVPPVRRTCRDAAKSLIHVIDESAARALAEDTRQDYSRLIAQCEMWLGLPRRPSLLRIP